MYIFVSDEQVNKVKYNNNLRWSSGVLTKAKGFYM